MMTGTLALLAAAVVGSESVRHPPNFLAAIPWLAALIAVNVLLLRAVAGRRGSGRVSTLAVLGLPLAVALALHFVGLAWKGLAFALAGAMLTIPSVWLVGVLADVIARALWERLPGVDSRRPGTDGMPALDRRIARDATVGGDVRAGGGATSFYPRVPQLMDAPPDLTAPEMYLVVKHGIRYSGMAAWQSELSDEDIWRVAVLLSRLASLPPSVEAAFKPRT